MTSMKRAVFRLLLAALAACGSVTPREVTQFPRSAPQPELERLLPDMKAGFPAERGKPLRMALVHSHGLPYVDAGKTHRRINVWVGIERTLGTGTQCVVEMHDYDQTKTDEGWTPPTWTGRSPPEEEKNQNGIIDCAKLAGPK
jgi:hypothetical protein